MLLRIAAMFSKFPGKIFSVPISSSLAGVGAGADSVFSGCVEASWGSVDDGFAALFFRRCCWLRRAWMREVTYSSTEVRISMPVVLWLVLRCSFGRVYI